MVKRKPKPLKKSRCTDRRRHDGDGVDTSP
jgi:hypothetical protein